MNSHLNCFAVFAFALVAVGCQNDSGSSSFRTAKMPIEKRIPTGFEELPAEDLLALLNLEKKADGRQVFAYRWSHSCLRGKIHFDEGLEEFDFSQEKTDRKIDPLNSSGMFSVVLDGSTGKLDFAVLHALHGPNNLDGGSSGTSIIRRYAIRRELANNRSSPAAEPGFRR